MKTPTLANKSKLQPAPKRVRSKAPAKAQAVQRSPDIAPADRPKLDPLLELYIQEELRPLKQGIEVLLARIGEPVFTHKSSACGPTEAASINKWHAMTRLSVTPEYLVDVWAEANRILGERNPKLAGKLAFVGLRDIVDRAAVLSFDVASRDALETCCLLPNVQAILSALREATSGRVNNVTYEASELEDPNLSESTLAGNQSPMGDCSGNAQNQASPRPFTLADDTVVDIRLGHEDDDHNIGIAITLLPPGHPTTLLTRDGTFRLLGQGESISNRRALLKLSPDGAQELANRLDRAGYQCQRTDTLDREVSMMRRELKELYARHEQTAGQEAAEMAGLIGKLEAGLEDLQKREGDLRELVKRMEEPQGSVVTAVRDGASPGMILVRFGRARIQKSPEFATKEEAEAYQFPEGEQAKKIAQLNEEIKDHKATIAFYTKQIAELTEQVERSRQCNKGIEHLSLRVIESYKDTQAKYAQEIANLKARMARYENLYPARAVPGGL